MLTVCTPTSVTAGSGTATINSNGSVTLTTVGSVTLNGVFSSTYDNYMVSIRSVNSGSTGTTLRGYMSSGGTIANGAGTYYSQRAEWSGTSITLARNNSNIGTFAGSSISQRDGCVIYFFGPFLTEYTMWRATSVYGQSNASGYDTGGNHTVASSYDGFYIEATSGTLTGLITVYGLQQ